MLWSRNFPLVWEIPVVKDVLYCVFVEKHPDLIKIQDPMKPQFACAAQRHVVVADIALRGAGWVPEERGHHWPAAAHTLPKRASLSFWGTAALLAVTGGRRADTCWCWGCLQVLPKPSSKRKSRWGFLVCGCCGPVLGKSKTKWVEFSIGKKWSAHQ